MSDILRLGDQSDLRVWQPPDHWTELDWEDLLLAEGGRKITLRPTSFDFVPEANPTMIERFTVYVLVEGEEA